MVFIPRGNGVSQVAWQKCPVTLANFCIGKEKTPTLFVLCVVDHNKRTLIYSKAYSGAVSDKQIVKDMPEMQALLHGLLKNVSFMLLMIIMEKILFSEELLLELTTTSSSLVPS